MSSTPHDNAPAGSSPEAHEKKRPIVWIVVAGVAILAAIGLGIWALRVNSDLNSTQSDLEAQQAATQAAEAQVAAQTGAATSAAKQLEQIDADNEIYVVSNEDVAQVENDVAEAEKAVADANAAAAKAADDVAAAQDEASKLRAELEQARAERELARAERQQARICARGSLGVLSRLGKSDADAATSELETVSSSCAATMSG